jgi:hypothetical protein
MEGLSGAIMRRTLRMQLFLRPTFPREGADLMNFYIFAVSFKSNQLRSENGNSIQVRTREGRKQVV